MFSHRLRVKLKDLEGENDGLRKKIQEIMNERNVIKEAHASQINRIDSIQKRVEELEKLKLQAREQNEADLLLSSLKIVAQIISGKNKEDISPEIDLQKRYMLAAQQNTNWQQYANNAFPLQNLIDYFRK